MKELIIKFMQNLHITISSEAGRLCVNAHIAGFSMEYVSDLSRLLEQKTSDFVDTAK